MKQKSGNSAGQDLSLTPTSTVDSLSSGSGAEHHLSKSGIYRRSLENALGSDKEISISTLKELALAGGGFPLIGSTSVAEALCATLKNSWKSIKLTLSQEKQRARNDMDCHVNGLFDRSVIGTGKCIYMEFPIVEDKGITDNQEKKLAQADIRGTGRVLKNLSEEQSEKEFVKENVTIKIKNYREGEDDFIETVISKVPSRHLNGIPSISVSNNTLTVLIEGKHRIARADYDRITNAITLNRKKVEMLSKKIVKREKAAFTILHEIGHHNYRTKVSEHLKNEVLSIAEQYDFKLFDDNCKI